MGLSFYFIKNDIDMDDFQYHSWVRDIHCSYSCQGNWDEDDNMNISNFKGYLKLDIKHLKDVIKKYQIGYSEDFYVVYKYFTNLSNKFVQNGIPSISKNFDNMLKTEKRIEEIDVALRFYQKLLDYIELNNPDKVSLG